jgi:hypothetical protein
MNSFYTYFHTRNDIGVVFYVGKGSKDRAYKAKMSASAKARYNRKD